MHVDSGESGSVPAAFARELLLGILTFALASCVTGRPRAPAPPGSTTAAGASVEPVQESVPGGGSPRPVVIPINKEEPTEPPQEQRQEPAKEAPGKPAATDETPPPRQPPAEERASETAPAATGAPPPTDWLDWLNGSLSVGYRGRSGGGDEDHEVRGVLALDVAHPSVPWVTGHLLARMDVDLEGLDGGEVFEDLSDTYDESVVAKLYLAYADFALDARPEESPGTLRVGRQSDPRLPEVLRLDGVSYLSRPLGKDAVELGAYGGIPVHLYEDSPEGDLAYGTFVEGQPWRGGRARLDWMHLEDEIVLGEEKDDLFAIGLWQDLPVHWRFEGEFSHLESDPRDLRLRAFYDDGDSETIVRVGYYELLETQTTRVAELDPFVEELLEYFPFRQANLNVSRVLGAHTVVDAGFDVRRVSDADDVGEFNRDWERYYATATVSDLATEGLALSATVDRWDDDDRDTSTFGADLSYEEERWRAAVGSYYSLYKYVFLEFDEREDVRTYYLRASREFSESLDLELLYEFEDDDLDTYHTLRLGASWRF